MIKGVVFRGIGYKCAMLHYSNSDWAKAIKEFETIVNESDPYIYEMMAKCYSKLSNNIKYLEYLQLAASSYEKCGETEKLEQIRNKLAV